MVQVNWGERTPADCAWWNEEYAKACAATGAITLAGRHEKIAEHLRAYIRLQALHQILVIAVKNAPHSEYRNGTCVEDCIRCAADRGELIKGAEGLQHA